MDTERGQQFVANGFELFSRQLEEVPGPAVDLKHAEVFVFGRKRGQLLGQAVGDQHGGPGIEQGRELAIEQGVFQRLDRQERGLGVGVDPSGRDQGQAHHADIVVDVRFFLGVAVGRLGGGDALDGFALDQPGQFKQGR